VTLPGDYHGDGENLLPAFEGKPIRRTKPIFWEWRGVDTEPDWWPRLAVREGDWKLVLTYDAKRVELHRVTEDRAEAVDVAEDHPDIVERLTQMALAWKASLPTEPDPACIDHQTRQQAERSQAASPSRSRVTPEVRARAFARWDTDGDGLLTLDEYTTGLKGQSNLETRFRNFDRNGDGRLTRDEFVGRTADASR
ncbi:MAG: hypothetical protein D6741_06120, partial [Planctomycetota bacterium]